MASIQNSISKGLTAINMKTSNFLEENKLKTYIVTLEDEIVQLKMAIGEKIYQNWEQGTDILTIIEPDIAAIKEKYAMIEKQKTEIEAMLKKEKEILGANPSVKTEKSEYNNKRFCSKCGAECAKEHHFCLKCGNKLD